MLSIGGFNVGSFHVPALGTVFFGGQATTPNVSTVGNPQPPTNRLTEGILINNLTNHSVTVGIDWYAKGAVPTVFTIPAGRSHEFDLNLPTDKTIYNPSVAFRTTPNANPVVLPLRALYPHERVSYVSGHAYTSNYYHFATAGNATLLYYNTY